MGRNEVVIFLVWVIAEGFNSEGLGEVNVASPDLESSTVGDGSRKRGEALPTVERKSKILP